MIALAEDCLLFQLANGESQPFSAETISIELMGNMAGLFDSEFVRHAADAVFYYFKHELGWKTVTVGDFAGALEKVLRGFKPQSPADGSPAAPETSKIELESDLCQLASESGEGCELFFFSRLRAELRQHLQQGPRLVRFRGLRPCVMQLAGVRRWTPRCRTLEEQIVTFLRECLSAEARPAQLGLVVE